MQPRVIKFEAPRAEEKSYCENIQKPATSDSSLDPNYDMSKSILFITNPERGIAYIYSSSIVSQGFKDYIIEVKLIFLPFLPLKFTVVPCKSW